MFKLLPRCSNPLRPYNQNEAIKQSWTCCIHVLHQNRKRNNNVNTHQSLVSSDPKEINSNAKLRLLLQQHRTYSKKDSEDDSFFSRATKFLTDTSEESLNKVYTERRLMGYSMQQMFDVVLDIAAYEKFLPWCKSSVLLDQRPNVIIAKMSIGIPPLTEKYVSEVKYRRPTLIIAEAQKGHLFNHLVNNWKFSPGLKSHPNSCVVDFSVSFQFKSSVTAKLGNVFFDNTAKAMTSAFYDEAKRRYGKESVPSVKIKIISKDASENKNVREKPS